MDKNRSKKVGSGQAAILGDQKTALPAEIPILVIGRKLATSTSADGWPAFPPHLDGSSGLNRRKGFNQLKAKNDADAIKEWLALKGSSPHTARAYFREANRLLVWSINIQQKPISSLLASDLKAFEAEFLANPPAEYREPEKPDRHLQPGPFLFKHKKLSASSIQHSMTVIGNLFSFLCQSGYLKTNPTKLTAKSPRRAKTRTTRYLNHEQYQFLLDYIENEPRDTLTQQQNYQRNRWVCQFLKETGLREFEAAEAKGKQFIIERGHWWFEVRGKARKENDEADLIPISSELMEVYAEYREFHELPKTPNPKEETPVILSLSGIDHKPITPTALYRFMKTLFRSVAKKARKAGREDMASQFEKASPHWMRHTMVSHQLADGIPLTIASKNARHRDIQTTMIYSHEENDDRHAITTSRANHPKPQHSRERS